MLWLTMMGCGIEVLSVTVEQSSDLELVGGTIVVEEIDGEAPDDLNEVISRAGWFDDMDLAGKLNEFNVGKGDIKDAYLRQFRVAVVTPQDGDLSFFDSIEFTIVADGLPEALVASANDIPEGRTSIDLDLEDLDLAPYLLSDGLVITPFAEGGLPPDTVKLRADLTAEVGITARAILSQL